MRIMVTGETRNEKSFDFLLDKLIKHTVKVWIWICKDVVRMYNF